MPTPKRERRVATNLTEHHYQLVKKLAKATSKSISEILRESLLINLAERSYLSDEEKKALGKLGKTGLNNLKGGEKS